MYLFGHLYTRWDHLSYLVEDALFYLFIFDGVVEDALNHKNKKLPTKHALIYSQN